MRAVVTGAAGFIGSHLCERLLDDGADVAGIDSFTEYYERGRKEENLAISRDHDSFEFVEGDVLEAPLDRLVADADVVFHLAGQPGVRDSWAHGFRSYLANNIHGTQRVLEAARLARVPRVVYASSSSLYGNAARFPCREDHLPSPYSPYGVTKLAGEHLCRLYTANYGLSTVSLRYFTVFGPRQRPDLAMMKLIESALARAPFPLFGDGQQIRDFTYVADVVDATARSGTQSVEPGAVFNVAGGSPASMNDVIYEVGAILGRTPAIERHDPVPGDVARTGGSTERIAAALGWQPKVALAQGLQRQVAWALERTFTSSGEGNVA